MSAPAPTYAILTRTHLTKWNDRLNAAQEGWDIQAQWNATGTVLDVFVPDTHYTAENVDTAIRAAGATDEQVHALGQ